MRFLEAEKEVSGFIFLLGKCVVDDTTLAYCHRENVKTWRFISGNCRCFYGMLVEFFRVNLYGWTVVEDGALNKIATRDSLCWRSSNTINSHSDINYFYITWNVMREKHNINSGFIAIQLVSLRIVYVE